MSTATRGRQYMAAQLQDSKALYRRDSYDRSFDSIRYPSNASQPSLSHSIMTHTESTPSSVCRPDFGDFPQDMANSDCGASFVSEVPAAHDDSSDIDDAPPRNSSKPSLKFVEPVVQRDHVSGQQRLTGMKKKMQRKMLASMPDGDMDVHQLPVLGFADSRSTYGAGEAKNKDMLNFPGVPPREINVAHRREQWNVDTLDIALEDLVLDRAKVRQPTKSPFQDASDKAKGPAVPSVLDEFADVEQRSMPPPRERTLSDARRPARGPPFDMPLPPLPPLPSSATNINNNSTPSADNSRLQPVDEPLVRAGSVSTSSRSSLVDPRSNSTRNSTAVDKQRSTPADEDRIFAFQPPSLSGHGQEEATAPSQEPRTSRPTGKRLDSVASSNHSSLNSSLRDMDPREVIQRARMQPMSCGLDAELASSSLDLASECAATEDTQSGVYAEDLPPLISNHYLQGQEFSNIDRNEYERLNRLPERMAAVASMGGGQRLSQKSLSKHRKAAGAPSAMSNYEPISILRAEAAFLKEEKKVQKDKKGRTPMWPNASSNSSVASSSRGSSSLGHRGLNTSSSDVSSVSEGQQRLRSFKSSIRLKGLK